MTLRECLKKIVFHQIEGFNVKEDHDNVDKLIQVLNDNVSDEFKVELFEYTERLRRYNFFSELYKSNNFENSMVIIGGYLLHLFDYKETLKHLNMTARVINLTRDRYIVVTEEDEKRPVPKTEPPKPAPKPETPKPVPPKPVPPKPAPPKRKRKYDISVFRIFDKILFFVMFFLFIKTSTESITLTQTEKILFGSFLLLTHGARSLTYYYNRRSILIQPTLYLIVGMLLNSAMLTFVIEGKHEVLFILFQLAYLGALFMIDRMRMESGKYYNLSATMFIVSPVILAVLAIVYFEINTVEDIPNTIVFLIFIALLVIIYFLSLIAPEEYFYDSMSLKSVLNVVFTGLFLIVVVIFIAFIEDASKYYLLLIIPIVITSGIMLYNRIKYF